MQCNAFRLARCPRSTVRDFVGIAELKTVDAKEHQLLHWFSETTSTGMSQTFATLSTNDDCHAEERRVLPLTLNPRLHEQECMSSGSEMKKKKTAPLGATSFKRVSEAGHFGDWELENLFNMANK